MSRTGKITKRVPKVDPIRHNRFIGRFISHIMRDGKRSIAESLVYRALGHIEEKGQDPIKVFETALNVVGPRMEVKPRRVGGASYQVPVEVRGDRRISLAIRWITEAARKRSNREYHTFDLKLSAELLDAVAEQGEAIRKRDMMHKTAESNKAFSHFRW